MFWSDPTSRIALTLRRLRSRLGWTSPGVTVRMALPWHWRAIAVVVLSSVSLALAGWIYDAGRSFSGTHHEENKKELEEMRERVLALETELADTRESANTSVSQLKMEATTQDRLAQQVKTLEEENLRLKADLAMFENFVGGAPSDVGLAINRLSVVSDHEPGRYVYHLLVSQQGKGREHEFKGRLQFSIAARRNGQSVTLEYPTKEMTDSAEFSIAFKLFRRLSGVLHLPADLTLESIEARLVEGGAIRVRQTVKF